MMSRLFGWQTSTDASTPSESASESADTSGATSADTSGATSADTSGATSADTSGATGADTSASTMPDAGTREVFDGLAFRYIPPGSFTMGSPEDERGRLDDETQHQVTLTRGFWLKETEVTQAEWQAVMGNNPSLYWSCGDTCPVETVNWWAAAQFCNALSSLQGLSQCYTLSGCDTSPGSQCDAISEVDSCTGYRLPTEAEWEHAYRAGTTTAFYNGGISQIGCAEDPNLTSIGWYCGNASNTPHPVSGKTPNAWGLNDMSGNVWEWVWDQYPDDSSGSSADDDINRILRGGSWGNGADDCRGGQRLDSAPTRNGNGVFGFRPARSYDPSQ
jgi:formylglycine-generating enzyme required for sulfatase activity